MIQSFHLLNSSTVANNYCRPCLRTGLHATRNVAGFCLLCKFCSQIMKISPPIIGLLLLLTKTYQTIRFLCSYEAKRSSVLWSKYCLQDGLFAVLQLIKGTVRPDWIYTRVIPLERPWKEHQPLYVFGFLISLLNISKDFKGTVRPDWISLRAVSLDRP